jgi:hypothetical protein
MKGIAFTMFASSTIVCGSFWTSLSFPYALVVSSAKWKQPCLGTK